MYSCTSKVRSEAVMFSWKMLRKKAHPLFLKFIADRKDGGEGCYLTVDGNLYIPSYDNEHR